MAKHIAMAGKGGTGKTTVAALLIKHLVEQKKGAILAVDADANANLNEALGYEVPNTISSILVDMKKGNVPTGMPKETYLQFELHRALIETEYVDLLVMGGPQGPGCYCFPTDILKRHLANLDRSYDYMVVDNEAGMEHISRQTIEDVDILLVISDATAKGVRTAGRIYKLAKSLNIKISDAYLIITKTSDPAPLQSEIKATGLKLLGVVPNDSMILDYDLKGKPMLDLPADSPAVQATREMFGKLPL
ncbi:MAG TPA: AAA family ATPase [Syntrophaceticus sp.]|jgi:CO dehydrogenase maturation factor|uniref:Carbon monoxide dehydrogenase nickel-insertion accessory protein AcsF n=1 Tax=Syntrophaceticus schinkii TaxID=499207 RepID=A0A0B7MQ58_9FIRM|nr:AAA family ATPase [Syntrophaceticus schinkii]HHY30748.1 AAA family ATPase [Syntrophaceticus sp.]MDD2359416.1 AAA family ATPase [Syntrophaceticus schinkii]MDD4260577.1 AAA family ATPase [Syntrophaceticus schinkii]MDD4674591.1 AAA family ATPase [Syntrophaceticus schinkii]CEO89817.1 carbon monoxide dehydrogenase nickel-insertion accessory protein AcsF [Syntrophaceticus schinkii]